MKKEIAELRKDYQLETLDESDVAANAIDQFTSWWQQAIKSEIDEVNAMTLATATKNGLPSARIVLLKDYEGYSYEEIGKITGLSESQVKVYLHRARLQLKNYLVKADNVL